VSELDLLVFGCAVTFIAVGGAYIYIREQYLASEVPKRVRTRPGRRRPRSVRSAREDADAA